MSAVVPSPDADGYWHYTYVTYHPDTGEWYGGKHSTTNLDDSYLGSGNWIRWHPARAELVMEIVEFFFSEEHAYAAELALVNFRIIQDDPLCRNERDGGFGMSREAAIRRSADPKYQRKHREAVARLAGDPEWQRKNREVGVRNSTNQERQRKIREAAARRNADPEYRRRNLEVGARNSADPEWRRKVSDAMISYHENGGTNPNAKLTAEQVIAIRKSGETTDVAASRHGVSCSAIRRIRNRMSWSNLP